MATPTKFSFSVRSILDLPERDAEAVPRSSPRYSSCGSSSSPYSSWMDCDRSPCISYFGNHKESLSILHNMGEHDVPH
ncbi:Homeobox protein Nkx-2.8 [Liparis tanakae]|uniref:Homeobox protein Nkx-2.8 n=1 Tax=Liparis tanakae TaxID=230148 RepID=A0A4Z2J5G9_9TELE|nr:Homeobox protein Nkx-2.8 [Liparis tanakae]